MFSAPEGYSGKQQINTNTRDFPQMLFWMTEFMENSGPLHTWDSWMVTWLDKVVLQAPSKVDVPGHSYLTQRTGTQ